MPDFKDLVRNLYETKGRDLPDEKYNYIIENYKGKEEQFVKNFYTTIGEDLTDDKLGYIKGQYLSGAVKKKETTQPTLESTPVDGSSESPEKSEAPITEEAKGSLLAQSDSLGDSLSGIENTVPSIKDTMDVPDMSDGNLSLSRAQDLQNKDATLKENQSRANTEEAAFNAAVGMSGPGSAIFKVLSRPIQQGILSMASGGVGLGAVADVLVANKEKKPAAALSDEWFKGLIQAEKVKTPTILSNQWIADKSSELAGSLQETASSRNFVSKVKSGIKNPNISTVEQFMAGNFKDGRKSLGIDIVSQIPQLAAVYATGGSNLALGGLGAVSAGNEFASQKAEDGDLSFTDFVQGSTIGIAEAVTSKFFDLDIKASSGILKGLRGAFTEGGEAIAKDIAKNGVAEVKKDVIRTVSGIMKAGAKGSFQEVLEENIVSVVDFAVSAIDEDKLNADSFKELLVDMGNNTLTAGVLGGGMSTLAAKVAYKPFTKEESRKIEQYKEILDNIDAPVGMKKIAATRLREINEGVETATSERYDKIAALPVEDRIDILNKQTEIEKNQRFKDSLDATVEGKVMADEAIKKLEGDIDAKLNPKVEPTAESDVASDALTEPVINDPRPIVNGKQESVKQETQQPTASNQGGSNQPPIPPVVPPGNPNQEGLTPEERQQLIIPEKGKKTRLNTVIETFKVAVSSTEIGKLLVNSLTHGDRIAVQAKEKTSAKQGDTIDRLNSISKNIQKIIKKDAVLRKAANTILSIDNLDDKLSKLSAISTEEAISAKLDGRYTAEEIAAITDIDKIDSNSEVYKEVSEVKGKDISEYKKGYATNVRELAGQYVNFDTVKPTRTEVDPNTGKGIQVAKTKAEVEAEIKALPRGQEVFNSIEESQTITNSTIKGLANQPNGIKLIEEVAKARTLIDDGSRYINRNKAAEKIKAKIGDAVSGNEGFYLKRTMQFWKDKKFKVSGLHKKVAQSAIEQDILLSKLPKLVSSKAYESATEDVKVSMVDAVLRKAEKNAQIELNLYLDEIRLQKDSGAFSVAKIQGDKVDAKSLKRRGIIDDAFLNILGNTNDPIAQMHDTILAQSQIRAAADLQWQINENAGEGKIYESKEALIEEQGDSKGFKEVTDNNTLLSGKWVSEDIYDVITGDSFSKSGPVWAAYAKTLSLMRMKSTVFNPAGWTTNLMGGWFYMAANGVFPVVNPAKSLSFLYNRVHYTLTGKAGTERVQNLIDRAKRNGMWNTSISAGMIKILDENYVNMASYDMGDRTTKNAGKKALNKLKSFKAGVIKGYSVIDDFSKLVVMDAKTDLFSQKLYGKDFSNLTETEREVVDAELSERIKQNGQTMSRLPRAYKPLSKVPFGDFLAFRLAAIQSAKNTIVNINNDFGKAFKLGLSTPQGRAYFKDASLTLASMSAVAALGSSGWSYIASKTMEWLSDDDEDFEKEIPGVGTKMELYTDFKGTPAVNPQWMRGKNTVVYNDDGAGEMTVIALSNKDPYDEFMGIFLERKGTTWGETVLGIGKEVLNPNMAVSLILSLQKGEDVWGRDIYSDDDPLRVKVLKVSAYIAKQALIPPSFLYAGKETARGGEEAALKELLSDAGATEEDYQEASRSERKKVDKFVKPTKGQYFDAFKDAAPSMINRTYKVNIYEQFNYSIKDAFPIGTEKFENLSPESKEIRLDRLSNIHEAYQYLSRYNELNNGTKDAGKALESSIKRYRIPLSDEEIVYIVTGQKVTN
ncbi:MAG: hypothetical protein ACJARG_000026 [Arcticibacterium sp.]|jgi:hypothetical protein